MPDYDLGTARGKIEIDASGAERGIGQAEAAVGRLGTSQREVAGTLQRTGLGLLGMGTAAIAGFGVAVNAAADFEAGISAIAAVSGATGTQLDAIRAKAMQLGADTKFSAGEAAAAMEELVKSGLSVDDVMNGAADATVALAAAGGVDLPTAATVAANAMNQFGLSAQDMPHIADLVAGAANASAIDVGQFAQSLQQAGAVANLVGVDFDDLTTLIAAMGNAGIVGSDAGTSIKTFLNNLQPTTEKQIALAEKLGIVGGQNSPVLDHFTQALANAKQGYDSAVATFGAGSQEAADAQKRVQKWQDAVNQSMTAGSNLFFDQNGHIKSMTEVSDILGASLSGLTDQEKTLALETLFGSDAIRAAAVVAQGAGDGFGQLGEAISEVSAADVAATRMDNLSGSIEQLKGSIETALISAGSPFQDTLRGVVDMITRVVNAFADLSPGVQRAIVIFVVATGAFLAFAGAVTFMVGTVMRFVQTMRILREAMGIGRVIQGLQRVMMALNATFLANPVVLIIAALVALGVAIFVLYRKSEAFRNFIDGLWQTLQRVWDAILGFFRRLPDFFKDIFNSVENVFNDVADVFTGFVDDVKRIIDDVVDFLQKFPGKVKDIIDDVVKFFEDLPGEIVHVLDSIIDDVREWVGDMVEKALDLGQRFVGGIIDFIQELPEKIAFIIGFVIGSVIRFHLEMIEKAIDLGKKFVAGIIDFLTELPGLLLDIFTTVIGHVASFISTMITKAIDLGTRFLSSIMDFLITLPGKLLDIFTTIISNVASFVADLIAKAADLGSRFVSGIIDIVTSLPGALWSIFQTVISNMISFVTDMVTRAINFASSLVSSIVNGIVNLPGAVLGKFLEIVTGLPGIILDIFTRVYDLGRGITANILQGIGDIASAVRDKFLSMIDSIKNLAQSAWDAAKHIAGNIWDGFKSGLGINSPSFIERAMVNIVDSVSSGINDLADQTIELQRLGATVPTSAEMGMTTTFTALGMSGANPVGAEQAPGAGMVVQGPLVHIENMSATEQDITQISRDLWTLSQRESVGQGNRIIAVGS